MCWHIQSCRFTCSAKPARCCCSLQTASFATALASSTASRHFPWRNQLSEKETLERVNPALSKA